MTQRAECLRLAGFIALLAALSVYFAIADGLPDIGAPGPAQAGGPAFGLPFGTVVTGGSLWGDTVIVAAALIPATFALMLLTLPLRTWRGLAPVGLAFAVLVAAADAAGLDVVANFAKLAAATAIGFWFLGFFERVSWVALVAAIIPAVDAISVWRGPTQHIVTERPEVFEAFSFAFPVPHFGAFNLGIPDLLFFAVFLAAAARFGLRVVPTWAAMTASFGVTLGLAIAFDPFDLGGLPALPLLSVGFLAPNADLLWRNFRARDQS